MNILRNPTLHFLLAWLLAPLFALVGAALDGTSQPVSTALMGWLVTFLLWAAFASRSVTHQWKSLPRRPGDGRPDLARAGGTGLRLLAGVGLIAILAWAAALVTLGLLALNVAGALAG